MSFCEFVIPTSLEEAAIQGREFGAPYLIATRRSFEVALDQHLTALSILLGCQPTDDDLLNAFEIAARQASENGGP